MGISLIFNELIQKFVSKTLFKSGTLANLKEHFNTMTTKQ